MTSSEEVLEEYQVLGSRCQTSLLLEGFSEKGLLNSDAICALIQSLELMILETMSKLLAYDTLMAM